MSKIRKKNSWEEKYDIIGELGKGGNATVYLVKNIANGREYALKVLTSGGDEKCNRFKNEICTMSENCKSIAGIMPIIDFSCEDYWYVMPIAEPIMNYVHENKLNLETIALGIISLCETLEALHNKGISHRDIKPDNIYFYNQRFTFGDFGLVTFPSNSKGFTCSDKALGAVFTIAPEMKRDPKNSNGLKADVFSLAKTFWMLLTFKERGFDGVYDYLDKSHSLGFIKKYSNVHLAEIHELLRDSTDNTPDNRPSITEFKNRLKKWMEIYSDPNKSQASDWHFLNKQLFGINPPDSSSWRDLDKIVNVLNIIGQSPAYNHMLFHDQGGLDFSYAERASEEGCIKLYDTIGFCYIVKPQNLYFESFDGNFEWNYFLLEFGGLEPIFLKDIAICEELLLEDAPSHYLKADYVKYGVSDYDTGEQLPDKYQIVKRYTQGKFLFVMKSGPYNCIPSAYDGRHGQCESHIFKEYVAMISKHYSRIFQELKSNEGAPHLNDECLREAILKSDAFTHNPFEIDSKKDDAIIPEYFDGENEVDISNINLGKLPQHHIVSYSPAIYLFKLSKMVHKIGDLSQLDYLSVDGTFCENNETNQDYYYSCNRREAIYLAGELQKMLEKELKRLGLKEDYISEYKISIVIQKSGAPTHLFTKQEIEELMRNADDRKDNQLVIDENGYAHIIDGKYAKLYPVRHEKWDAGNVYVGKYSSLSTLDDDYISSLQGWLIYLKTGNSTYVDYVHSEQDETKLINEISQFYDDKVLEII